MNLRMAAFGRKVIEGLTTKKVLLLLLGAMICSFGIHNIHQRTNITEGGIIGLMLLIEHWLHVSPAYITPLLDIACYALAFRFLGAVFIKLSIVATLFIAGFIRLPSDCCDFRRRFCRRWRRPDCQARRFQRRR